MRRLRKIEQGVKDLNSSMVQLEKANLIYAQQVEQLTEQLNATKFDLMKATKERNEFLQENIRLDNKLAALEEEIQAVEDKVAG